MLDARCSYTWRPRAQVCISSYQYALLSTESWLHAPQEGLGGASLQQHYRSLPAEVGVAKECRRALRELHQMARLYASSARESRVLTLRLEEVEGSSSGSYLPTTTTTTAAAAIATSATISTRWKPLPHPFKAHRDLCHAL